jgi:demethylmacrocin O-methyltransferase
MNGQLDIVVDDGSHRNEHVIDTFKILFPLLSPGGYYVVEDLQTSYWSSEGGDSLNLNNPATSMSFFKGLADGLNYEEFERAGYTPSYTDQNIVALHFYHNMVFIRKGPNNEGTNRR